MIFYYCAECSTQHSVNWWAMEGVCDPLREGSTHLFFSPSRLLCCLLQLLCLFVSCSDISEIVCVCTCETKREWERTLFIWPGPCKVYLNCDISQTFFVYWAISAKCQLIICWVVFFLFICLLVCTLIFKSMGRRL